MDRRDQPVRDQQADQRHRAAVGRWGLVATALSLAPDLLVPLIGVLAVALVVNIVAIFRTPVPPAAPAPASVSASAS